jgi:hypothetical protein
VVDEIDRRREDDPAPDAGGVYIDADELDAIIASATVRAVMRGRSCR